MTSWSAWNVTGNLNSELLRLLSEIQVNLATLQNSKVTKGGDAVLGTGNRLTIGTTTNNEVELVSNNQSCFRLTPDGNVFLPNQMMVDTLFQDNQHPNICGALNTNTGMSIEGPDMVQFVGNGNLTAQIDNNHLIVNSNTIRFGDQNGPRIQHSGNTFNVETVGNHDLNLYVQGSKGVTLTRSNHDLDISTTTGGNGTTQLRVNGPSSATRPQYSFSDGIDSGMYVDSAGQVSFTQTGEKVFNLTTTTGLAGRGIDVGNRQIFFDTLPNVIGQFYPQLCFDKNGARDTGIFSTLDGAIQMMNNNAVSMVITNDVISHANIHNNAHADTGNTVGIINSYIHTVGVSLTIHDFGDPSKTLNNLQLDILYTRVGNIVSAKSNFMFRVPTAPACDALELAIDLWYNKTSETTTTYNPPGGDLTGWQFIKTNMFSHLSLFDNTGFQNNRVASTAGSYLLGPQRLQFYLAFNSPLIVGRTYTAALEFSYPINLP